MNKLKKLIRELSNKSAYEKVLLKIKESLKPKKPKKEHYIIIRDALSSQNQQMSINEALKILYNQFHNCSNLMAIYKMLLILDGISQEVKGFSGIIEMEKLFVTVSQQKLLNSSKDIELNLLSQYIRYFTQFLEGHQYFEYAELIIRQESLYLFDGEMRNLMASQVVLVNLLKNLKSVILFIYQLIPYLEYVITKKYSPLIDEFSFMIFTNSQIIYNFISQFINRFQDKILCQNQDNQKEIQLLYQLYQDVIQITIWMKKLLQLSNLTKGGLKYPPIFYEINIEKNRKYELMMQGNKQYQNEYDYPTPVASPYVEIKPHNKVYNYNYYYQNLKQMSLNVKVNNDLTTQLAQSDRPLSYNKFNDLEK